MLSVLTGKTTPSKKSFHFTYPLHSLTAERSMESTTSFILETARDSSHGGPYRLKNVQTTPPPPVHLLLSKASQSGF